MEKKALTVTELTKRIKTLLESQVGEVWVEGEVSNFRAQSSGHLYFTLKDEAAQLSSVMFRGNASKLDFKLQDGLKIRVYGEISVYEARGNYQIIIRRIERAGEGELQARFEALKRKLQAEGLFDADRKRSVPKFPTTIGLITSPTGAVIQDFTNVKNRRWPGQKAVMIPVKVQGDGAAEEIAAAVEEFNRLENVDVIVLMRGGGSLEDLWAFNEEIVARAVASSQIPTVSAVGHETDFTICDFVADLRAPTPSAAAEILVPSAEEWMGVLRTLKIRLYREVKGMLQARTLHVRTLTGHAVFREPARVIGLYQQKVDDLTDDMKRDTFNAITERRHRLRELRDALGMRSPTAQIARYRQRLALAAAALPKHATRKTLQVSGKYEMLAGKLKLLSPLNALSRGYSLVRDAQGNLVRSISQIKKGDQLITRLADGEFDSVVSKTQKVKEPESKG